MAPDPNSGGIDRASDNGVISGYSAYGSGYGTGYSYPSYGYAGAPIGAAGKTKNPSTWEGFLALSEGEVGLVPHPADLGASRIKR
jgi:hypothetical protein